MEANFADECSKLAAQKFAQAGKCEGACEQHDGVPRVVHVDGWGWFSYCDAAVVEDQRRGLTVTEK